MSMGWWLTLVLVLPAFGLATWMWLVVARFNLDGLSLGDMPDLLREG